jgi:hypothetical protein
MAAHKINVSFSRPAWRVIAHIAALKGRKRASIVRDAVNYWISNEIEVRQLCLEWDPRPGAFEASPRRQKQEAVYYSTAPVKPRDPNPPINIGPTSPWWGTGERIEAARKKKQEEAAALEMMTPERPPRVDTLPIAQPIISDEEHERRRQAVRDFNAQQEAQGRKRLRAEEKEEAKRARRQARFAETQARRAEKKAALAAARLKPSSPTQENVSMPPEPEREIPLSTAKLMPQFGQEQPRQTTLDEAIAATLDIANDVLSSPSSAPPAAAPSNSLGRTWRWKPPAERVEPKVPEEPFDGF